MIESMISLIISASPNPNLPGCWTMQPGPPLVEGHDGWYLEGEHKLDVPVSWDVHRTYQELASYGWCVAETVIGKSAQQLFDKAVEVVHPPKPLVVTDWVLQSAIGLYEGTRDAAGNPTPAYYGHTDPGWSGRCQNIGSFSYQHCASSPEEADKIWLEVLRNSAQPFLTQKAVERFGQPLSAAALVVGLDAWTQSPDAGQRFVGFLETHDPTPDQLIDARVRALTKSREVLGGPETFKVQPDQERRVGAILGQLKILHQQQREAH
jgi:hypothetical protein